MSGDVGLLVGFFLFMVAVVSIAGYAFVPRPVRVLLDYRYGTDLIAAAVVCLVLAQLVIRKIVDIKI